MLQVSNFIWFLMNQAILVNNFVVELNGEVISKEKYTTTKLTAADIVWQAHPDFICAVSEITESDNIQNTVYELMNGYSSVR